MPVFAFGFGSFGDILAAVQLAVRIAIILRQSGNSTECAETEKALKALSGDLDLADRTLQQTAGSPLAPFVAARIRDEIVQCHKLMARFFMKITTPQSLVQKVRWAASQEKKLAKFRTQIIERRSALGLIMDVINSGALMAVRDRIDDVSAQVRQGHTLIQDVHNGVSNVAQQFDDVGGQVRQGHTLIQDVQSGVNNVAQQLDDVGGFSQRLDEVGGQVRHGHSLIQDSVSGLVEQLATYHAQIVAVINHVPHGVSQAMFVVVSPTGISIPVSVTFCTSYSVLDDILRTYMRGRKEAGGHYVERGDYSIVSPEGDTIYPPAFTRTLKAGLLLEMSIIKRGGKLYGCPQCKSLSVWDLKYQAAADWTWCKNPECSSTFRTRRRARRPIPVFNPWFPPTSARDPPADEDEDETTCFRRIEVVAPVGKDRFSRLFRE
ncbi:hypothetical protein DFH09DRAFT_493488 [Mycena vulgaris]|nr:hypothetical protein DFH09DRAFT_493488 [Mycena vulgaris]